MSTHTPQRSFLLIGLAWDELPKLIPDPAKVAEMEASIRAGLERNAAQFQQAGLYYEQEHYGLGEGMERCARIVKAREWDGVVIGGGIRTIPQYMHLFEQLVNTIKDNAPRARIIFNTKPDDTLEAVKRWFPDV